MTLAVIVSDRDPPIVSDNDPSNADQCLCFFQIEAILKDYILDIATYKKISALLDNECRKGLSPATNDAASVKMYPTYVRGLPDGTGTSA